MSPMRPTFAEVNLGNIQLNAEKLRTLSKTPSFFCPMIKANAYGHGDYEVARALEEVGISQFGVALVEEGVGLRQKGVDASSLFVFGSLNAVAAQAVVDFKLTPVVSSLAELQLLADCSHGSQKQNIHLKLDTGMHRMGMTLLEFEKALSFLQGQSTLQLNGVCTHLADAEDVGDVSGKSLQQLHAFADSLDLCKKLGPEYIHVFNSAGLVGIQQFANQNPWSVYAGYGVRPGISIYGASPDFNDPGTQQTFSQLDLRPGMRLTTEVVHLTKVKAGESISYSSQWRAFRDSVIATLPVGYADGLFRYGKNHLQMVHAEHFAPQVGTICMDYTMVDITDWPGHLQKAGVSVDIFGDVAGRTSVSEVARHSATIPYEILTSISSRVPRKYLPTTNG